MQLMFENTYEMLIDAETAMLLNFHINPFDLGDLPILDFIVYKTRMINMVNAEDADI